MISRCDFDRCLGRLVNLIACDGDSYLPCKKHDSDHGNVGSECASWCPTSKAAAAAAISRRWGSASVSVRFHWMAMILCSNHCVAGETVSASWKHWENSTSACACEIFHPALSTTCRILLRGAPRKKDSLANFKDVYASHHNIRIECWQLNMRLAVRFFFFWSEIRYFTASLPLAAGSGFSC